MSSESEKKSFVDSLLRNNFFKITGTLTAFLASLVGIVIAVPTFIGNTPKIEVRLQESELLTQKSNVKGLVSHYTYNGDTVNSLWRCRIAITNVGNKTIIGRGNHSDLLDSLLKIDLNPDFNLVKVEKVVGTNIPIGVSFQGHELQFKFDQWLVDEKIEIIGYFINNKALSTFKLSENQKRSIENGEIVVVDRQNSIKNSGALIDKFNYPIPLISRTLSFFFILFLFGFITMFLFETKLDSAFIFWNWKKKYYNQYLAILANNQEFIPKTLISKFPNRATFSEDEINTLVINFNKELTTKFNIPAPPFVEVQNRKLSIVFTTLVVCLLMLLILILTALCIITY